MRQTVVKNLCVIALKMKGVFMRETDADPAVIAELAPNGKLLAGINLSNFLLVTDTAANGLSNMLHILILALWPTLLKAASGVLGI